MSEFCRIAAPSWVFPGSILDNCRFLEGKVDEVALLFFDAESSLAYTRQDLPSSLASLALSYHVHLPSVLPWEKGGDAVAALCLRLMEKVAHLGVGRCVLHPPPARGERPAEELLEGFAGEWEKAGRSLGDICVENTRENDLAALIRRRFFTGTGFGLCLDLGHILAYGQQELAALVAGLPGLPGLPGASCSSGAYSTSGFGAPVVRMVHCNAPGEGEGAKSAHLPLTALDGAGLALGEALCALLPPEGILVAELFSWAAIAASMPRIRQWMAERARGAACGG